MKTKGKFITPIVAEKAGRRRMPALMDKLNAKIRNGERYFFSGGDIPEGMITLVIKQLLKDKWEVQTNASGSVMFRGANDPPFRHPGKRVTLDTLQRRRAKA